MKSSEGVVKRVVEILMEKLGVAEIDETKRSLLMGSKRIKLNYYPICPNPHLALGVGRHSDVSTLTVLQQDHVGGLHVRRPTHGDATWVHVSPVPGSLVINIGDALQIMSNGRFKSVEHFVAANGSSNRISIPIFVNPEPSAIIGPLSEVLATGQKPEYKQVLYSDYVRHFYNNPHHGKNSIEFAKI